MTMNAVSYDTETDWLLANNKAVPCAASIAASEEINGGILSRVMAKPFKNPIAAPAPIPPSSPTHKPYGLSRAETTTPKAPQGPTEQSIQPLMITKHITSATRANMELYRKTVSTLNKPR